MSVILNSCSLNIWLNKINYQLIAFTAFLCNWLTFPELTSVLCMLFIEGKSVAAAVPKVFREHSCLNLRKENGFSDTAYKSEYR